jgi:hypothetical protein
LIRRGRTLSHKGRGTPRLCRRQKYIAFSPCGRRWRAHARRIRGRKKNPAARERAPGAEIRCDEIDRAFDQNRQAEKRR